MFFGRWLPVLRFTAALLAGVNEMPWRRFFVFNFMGGAGLGVHRRVGGISARHSASSLFEAIGLAGLLALVLSIAGHIAWRRSQRGRAAGAAVGADLNESGE